MLNIVTLRVPYKLVCMILKHVMNSRKTSKVYLSVFNFNIMHGCMGYIGSGLFGCRYI
jgi:hypothetical protein